MLRRPYHGECRRAERILCSIARLSKQVFLATLGVRHGTLAQQLAHPLEVTIPRGRLDKD